LVDFVNICPMFAAIISKKLATLKELDEYYTYDQALDLHEILTVNSFNEKIMYDALRKE